MLRPSETGIRFRNTLSEQPTPHRTELLFEYFSNGGGVAAGDLNGDGLEDLYFTGNMVYNSMYLNRGGMHFEDVTRAAGVAGRPNTWKTGVTFADVNGDGRLDIYVCYSGDLPLERRIDELYINQGNDGKGIPRFAERAREYGLANPHSSDQAYFFDYDRDGDLDLFLLTHNVKTTSYLDLQGTRKEMEKEDPVSGVRFYRNDHGHFNDVTRHAGLSSSALTYGLGAGISDVDKDGWIDIYVGNDYSPPDYLYMNNGDGTFSDELGSRIGHTPYASMGVDVADINNDGWSDIMVVDMLAADNRRQKTSLIPNDRRLFAMFVQSGFHHQYMRNMLQLNNGDGTFSEIGQLAGVSNTDWSWAPLIADFDNDGWKDLFITNGTLHDATDLDFLAFKRDYVAMKRQQLDPRDIALLMARLPTSDVANYAFRNEGNLRFRDVSSDWGLGVPLKSTGAAYSDLDNDGDLDLVTNNINEYASLFENQTADASDNNYLQIELKGTGKNTFGLGAKVTVYAGGEQQYAEQMSTRGYLSTVTPILHFGLGSLAAVDSVHVIWPDGKAQTLMNVGANRRITVHQENAVAAEHASRANNDSPTVFKEVPSPITFEHRMAGDIDDFRRQPLMDHPRSFLGPPLVKADVNGDGLVDVFAGGGNGQAGRLYLQQRDGRFVAVAQPALEADKRSQDVAAVFLDYNRDGF
ncbi:MAG TPA: VCBS repeat-containing protein, partial [Gemmatimonadales bacterium]|nr:VCBS repeat-containing protein [Gemmatimonadales bacterium]